LIQLSLAALSLRIGADSGIHLETIQTPQLPHGYILEETTAPNLQVDDENGGKAMNPMDSVFDLDALRKALLLGKFSWEVFLKRVV